MHKAPSPAGTVTLLRRKKFLGLTLGLLLLDSVTQAKAHDAGGPSWVPTPHVTPVSNHWTSPQHTNTPGQNSLFNAGSSTFPAHQTHSQSSGSSSLGVTNATTSARLGHSTLTGVTSTPLSGTGTTELGQSGHNLDLDLTSTTANIVLGSRLFESSPSVTISVGGVEQTFKAGSQVTAAEYVAIQQVLGSGTQGVTLSGNGAATGGTFSLNAVDSRNVIALVIPSSVTALDYVSRNATINVNGDLVNYGSIDAVSTSSKITSGTISAADITNEAGATITSVLPSSLATSLGATSASSLSLTLDATNNLTNAGSITSSGNLSLSAGGNIVNAPSLAGAGAGTSSGAALIQAANNVNLSSGSGNITNSGLIASNNASINISTNSMSTAAATANLNINNTGGTMQALNGAINVGDALNSGSANTNLTGGNWLSQQLNINADSGNTDINVDQLTGVVNVNTGTLFVAAQTPNLTMGTVNATGDPTLLSTGLVNLTSEITAGGPLIIVAGGSITSLAGATVDTSSTTGSGGNVVMVAGALFTVNAPGTQVSITGASASGGAIDLTQNGGIPTFNTSSTAGVGGNVTLAAYSGGTLPSSTGGQIALPNTVTITTSGSSGFANGSVTIVAGAQSTAATPLTISTGDINTANATGAGAITIATAQPNATAAAPVVVSVDSTGPGTGNGAILSGSFLGGAAQPGAVSVGNLTATGAAIAISGGTNGNVTPSPSLTTGTISGSSVTLSTTGGSIVTGTIDSSRISLIARGGDVGTSAAPIAISGGGAGVTLYAQATGTGTGQGGLWITDGTAETVTLSNGSSALGATVSFNLTADGSIVVSTPINTAITGANVTLRLTGNIGSAAAPLLINNAGNGLVLYAAAGAGNLWITDNSARAETLTLNNTSGPLQAAPGGIFDLVNDNGSIVAATPGSPAIQTATISLIATNGSIGSSAASQVNVESAGPGGLSLFAQATGTGSGQGSVWITDNGGPGQVTLSNGSGPLSAAVSFSLTNSVGNIVASTLGSTAIISPVVSLTAINGSIGTSAASPLLVNNAGGGLSLFASSPGGAIWITDNSTAAETITLNNSASALSTSGVFVLINKNGSILAAAPASTAVTAGSISLTATGGDIGGAITGGVLSSPLLVNNGGATLTLFADATGTGAGQGSALIAANSATAENLALSNASSPLSASVSFGVTNENGNIVANTPGSTAITSPSVALAATGGDIGTSAASQVLVNNGGGGLLLSASATGTGGGQGSLWVTDNAATAETVTLNNTAAPSNAAVLFSLTNTLGSIAASTPASLAITSPSITLTAGGNITADGTASGAALLIGNGGAGVGLSATAGGSLNIGAGETVTTTGNVTATGALALTASALTNANTVSGASVQITAAAGQALTITNTGNITATSGNIEVDSASNQNVIIGNGGGATGSFTVSGGNLIIVNANGTTSSTNSITFNNTQNLNTGTEGYAVLNANAGSGQSVNVPGTLIGNNNVAPAVNLYVNSTTYAQTGFLTNISLHLNSGAGAGTIIDTSGNLTLSSLTFKGESLTILATGLITSSGAITIDLSGVAGTNKGNGGGLNIISGYSFTPTTTTAASGSSSTGVPTPVTGNYTITGLSGSGGGVNLSDVTINTGTTVAGGNGGNVLVVAAGPTSASGGNISVGSINTSGAANGGSVTLIGQGINVAGINTIGTTGPAGAVTIESTAPVITSTVIASNGFISGTFGPSATYAGNITIGSGGINAGTGTGAATITLATGSGGNIALGTGGINAGSGTVTLTTGGTGSISTSGAGIVTAGTLNLNVGAGSAGTATQALATDVTTINSAGTSVTQGSVYLTDSNATTINVADNAVGIFDLVGKSALATISIDGNIGGLDSFNSTISTPGAISFTGSSVASAQDSARNGGSISLSASVFNTPTGIVLVGANGSSPGNGGSVSINVTGTGLVTLGGNAPTNSFNLQAVGENGGSVSITTAGALFVNDSNGTIPASAISVAPLGANGNGGSIALSANSISWTNVGTDALIVSAPATAGGTGTGGSVSVALTGTQGSAATLGTAAGDFNLQAQGYSGGSASFSTTGALQINDVGGNVNVSSGPINVTPQGTNGNGGNVSLTANSITWTSQPANALSVTSNGVGTGNGGSVAINLISLGSTVPALATIGPAADAGDFNLTATGTNGGSASFSTTGPLNIVTDASGNANYNPAIVGSLPTSYGINVAPTGALGTGNGGSIALTAGTLAWGTSGSGNGTPLILNADGGTAGTLGLGGFISVNQTSSTGLTVGTQALQIELSAQGGNNTSATFNNGNGSGVSVASGGNLVVNPNGINVTATLAGSGGENIALQSNSPTTFNVGLATSKNTNGVLGTLNVESSNTAPAGEDGSLTFINLGGEVTNSLAFTSNVGSLTMIAGGKGSVVVGAVITTENNVTLSSALGTGSITGSATVNTDNLALSSGTGSIGALTVSASTVSANSTGGAVTVTDVLAGTATISNSSSGLTKAFSFTDTLGNIATNGNINAGTALTLKASATSVGNGSIFLGTGDLNAAGTGGAVTLTAGGSTAAGGAGNITAAGGDISAAKTVTLTAAKGSIDVYSVGAVTTPATVTMSALNNITNNGAVSATTSITEKTTNTASNSTSAINVLGNIETTSATAATGTIALTSTGTGLDAINAEGLDISAGKSVTLAAGKGGILTGTIGGVTIPQTVAVTALAGIANSGPVRAATTITETATGTDAEIVLNRSVETTSTTAGTGAVTLTASGTGGLVFSPSADIGAGKSVTISAAKGTIILESIGGGVNSGGRATPTTVALTALDEITTVGLVQAATTITEKATGTIGVISVGGNMETTSTAANTGTISITSAGTGSNAITSTGSDIGAGKSVTISATKGGVSVGSIGGGASVTGGRNTPATVSIAALSGVTNSGIIKATTTVTESATGTDSIIAVNGNILASGTSTGVVTLTDNATGGAITANLAATDISGGKSVTLSATKGSITVGSIGATQVSGIVKVTALNSLTGLDGGSIDGGTSLTLSQTSTLGTGISVNNISTTNGAISVVAAGTVLNVDAGAIIHTGATSSKTTSITLEDSNTASGNLVVGAASQITTSAITGGKANVNITIGAVPGSPTASAPTISGVSYTPLQPVAKPFAYFIGTNGVSLAATATSFISFNYVGTGQVIVNNASKGTGVLTINGGGATTPTATTITADPPVASAAPSMTTLAQPRVELVNVGGFADQPQIATGTTLPSASDTAAGASALSYSLGAGSLQVNTGALGGVSGNAAFAASGVVPGINGLMGVNGGSINGGNVSQLLSLQSNSTFDDSSNIDNTSTNTAAITGMDTTATATISDTTTTNMAAPDAGVTTLTAPPLGTISVPATRTLYGAASQFAVPAYSTYIGNDNTKIGEIEATFIGMGAGAALGIDGVKKENIEMAGADLTDRSSEIKRAGQTGHAAVTGPGTKIMTLRKGNIVVAPDKDTIVETSFGKVAVAAKSMALIMALPTGTAVYNLDDTCKNSVVLTVGKSQLSLAPGRHAMITSHLVESFEMVNPAETFGYRNVSTKKIDGDLQAFTSEFSMADAIGKVKQLRQLVNSRQPKAKRMAGHLLKTAAIMSQLNGAGAYESYQHPRVTAMALGR